FLHELQSHWNAWLRERYGLAEKLRQAWGSKQEPPGGELLINHDFARGLEHWTLERHEKAEATARVSDELPAALRGSASASGQIQITQKGTSGWHVQFNQSGVKLQAERPYTLSFWARADRPLSVTAQLAQAHEPWQTLGLEKDVKLTTAWHSFRFVFLASAT